MLIYIIAGICLGGLGVYLLLRKKLKTVEVLDQKTISENKALRQLNSELKEEHSILDLRIANASNELNVLSAKKDEAIEYVKKLDEQAQIAGEALYNSAMEKAQANIELSMQKLSEEYQEAETLCREHYERMAQECASEMSLLVQQKQKEVTQCDLTLAEMRSKSDSAVAANKRAEEIRQSAEFYKLHLSEVDIQEIEMLRNVAPYLRDKEPLNKVIWKCYYEKPTTDLIGRVVGSGIHTGIYKITNLENGMCYVGQAVSIADRWKQHIKRGVGAETPTRNKLYPAMVALGPESFSFEVIEECDKQNLDEREDYWQDYFKAKEFGYSIK